jgi:hypothetical protein
MAAIIQMIVFLGAKYFFAGCWIFPLKNIPYDIVEWK